ncbi:hypothetical protein [Pedobacter sp. SG908]|uniref:hypothetical protein n=1 Tax=Pedobacter sp. SG908 TaxID=2587135 RepID=UPI0014200ED9|nr:hypothetical protein [Pedobacter sp. SG908]NII83192.1 hypothetical protein [Pedobacter sp. SG908]
MKKTIGTDLSFLTIVLVLTAFVYWPVYRYDFLIGWDDQWFVTNHYTENGFTGKNICQIFSDFYYGQYAPINQIYYTLIYSLTGYSTGTFHLLSVCLHYCNCILVYYFLKGLLPNLTVLTAPNSSRAAFIATLMFAILPINVEPVSWVAASKVLIYATFYLLALITYQRYLKSGKPVRYYLVILLFLLSFGAKEQAVTLPVCLLALDYLYGRNLKDKLIWLEKLPLVILAVLMGLVTMASQQIDRTEFYTITQRIPLFFFSISEYFTKIIIPVNLSYLYPFPFQKTDPIPSWMWIHTFSIPIITVFLLKYFKKRILFFCFSFFIIHIILVSNAVSLARFSVIADRYAYVSSIGICLITAMLFFKYATAEFKGHMVVRFVGIVYLTGLIWTSVTYVRVWQNVYTVKSKLRETIEARKDYQTIQKK